MKPAPRLGVFGVALSVTRYEDAVARIMEAGAARRSFAMSALAVHGLMEAASDPALRRQVNSLDLVTPDGQPVRWAMNWLHRAGLRERVYGPDLTRMVCAAAAAQGIGIFLFGSTRETCDRMQRRLERFCPGIRVVGIQPDRFREATPEEDEADIRRINESGAGIVLVGRGCPRQERWVAAHRGRIDAAMLAVGAAFDYIAGTLPQPPAWMQRCGLEWLFRLYQEPGRLWRRYLVTNTRFMLRLTTALLTR